MLDKTGRKIKHIYIIGLHLVKLSLLIFQYLMLLKGQDLSQKVFQGHSSRTVTKEVQVSVPVGTLRGCCAAVTVIFVSSQRARKSSSEGQVVSRDFAAKGEKNGVTSRAVENCDTSERHFSPERTDTHRISVLLRPLCFLLTGQYRTTVWHEIFAGSNFREFGRFSFDRRKFDPAKINPG